MKNGKRPDPNVIHPIVGYDKEIYVKPTISNPNIIVGDFTNIADSEFESHVTHAQTAGVKYHLMFINYCRIVNVSIIILSLIMMFSILMEQNILLKILKNILESEV